MPKLFEVPTYVIHLTTIDDGNLCVFQIPMLLDDSSEHILNGCADDLIQDSSMHQDMLDSYPSLDELGGVDPMQWVPEAFPNLASLSDVPGVLRQIYC